MSGAHWPTADQETPEGVVVDKKFFDEWFYSSHAGHNPGGIAGKLGAEQWNAEQARMTPGPGPTFKQPDGAVGSPGPQHRSEEDRQRIEEANRRRFYSFWQVHAWEAAYLVMRNNRRPFFRALFYFQRSYLRPDGQLALTDRGHLVRDNWAMQGKHEARVVTWYLRRIDADAAAIQSAPGFRVMRGRDGRLIMRGSPDQVFEINGETFTNEELVKRLRFAEEARAEAKRGRLYPPVRRKVPVDCFTARPDPVSPRAFNLRIRKYTLGNLAKNRRPYVQDILGRLHIALPSQPVEPGDKIIYPAQIDALIRQANAERAG